MYFREKILIFFHIFLLIFDVQNVCKCEDLSITVNVRKSLHIVSDQFISFCVDPASFFKNVKIRTNDFNIVSALSPAFIRLSGPSTKVLTWVDPNKSSTSQIKRDVLPDLFELTPDQWISFNEWVLSTNLTTIFALNDRHRINGVWDPRDSLALMTLTDQMGFSCFWELGYESTNTSLTQYISDLTSLQHILDAFSSSKDYWGTVGSDFSGCLRKPNLERIRNFLLSVESSLDAINWHLKTGTNHLSEKDPIVKALMPSTKTNLPVMLTVPPADNSASFRNALEWALQLGDAAKYGFGVIFRQPTNTEMITETPIFWVSLFHKNLVGKNVLDTRINNINRTVSQVYCHCTKRQNNYIRRGAITLFAVNSQNTNMSASVHIFLNPVKSIEIQSYILTSNGDLDDSEIFLNNEKLVYDSAAKDGKLELSPKVRRVRMSHALTLDLPPYSVGFFVIPGARSPACITGEDERDLIVEEIIEDQNLGDIQLFSIQNSTENVSDKTNETSYEFEEKDHRHRVTLTTGHKHHQKHKTDLVADTTRQYLINRAKLVEKHKAQVENEQQKNHMRHKLLETLRNSKNDEEKLDANSLESIELTSEEIKLILSERKRKRQARQTRHKRFLPIDLIKDFAEKNQKEKKDEVEATDQTQKRLKRDLDLSERFARKRGNRLDKRKKDDDLEAQVFTNINSFDNGLINQDLAGPPPPPPDSPLKPIKITAQADVFADLAADDGKNKDYDYLETEEDTQDNTFKFDDNKFQERSRLSSRRNKGDARSKTGVKDGRFIDTLTFHTLGGDDVNEWSIMDGDEQMFHTPHEVFEKFHDNNFAWDVKNDWKDYGELFEVDSLKDSMEDDDQYADDNLFVEDYVDSNEEFQEEQPVGTVASSYAYQTIQNIEEIRTSPPPVDMKAQESQVRQIRVRAPNYFEQLANRTKNYNFYDQQMIQPINKTTDERIYDNLLPFQQRRRQKMPTEFEQTTSTTTTTTPTPFPLFTSPKPRRRRPKPDDIPEYMRFKRDISYIQKIPPKKSNKNHGPNNIQTIAQKNNKNTEKSIKKYHRDRRDLDSIHVEENPIFQIENDVLQEEKDDVQQENPPVPQEEKSIVQEEEDVAQEEKLPVQEEKDDISDKSLQKLGSEEVVTTISPIDEEIQTVEPSIEPLTTAFLNDDLISVNEESSTIRIIEDNDIEDDDYPEHFKYIIGKPLDLTKLKPLNEKKMNNFQQYLKKRLTKQRKKLEKKNGSKGKETDRNETTIQNELDTSTSTSVDLATSTQSEIQDIIEKLEENQEIQKETSKREIKKRNLNSDGTSSRKSLKSKHSKVKRRSASYDDYFSQSIQENEIFDDTHEHFERIPAKFGKHIYKINTPNGKKVIHFDTLNSAEQFEWNLYHSGKRVEISTTASPLIVVNKVNDDSSDSWSDDEDNDNLYVESNNNEQESDNDSDNTNKDDNKSDDDSWDMSSDESDENKHKKVFIVGGGQSFGNRASQLFGNFMQTLSNVIGRVHKRLSGYLTVLQ